MMRPASLDAAGAIRLPNDREYFGQRASPDYRGETAKVLNAGATGSGKLVNLGTSMGGYHVVRIEAIHVNPILYSAIGPIC